MSPQVSLAPSQRHLMQLRNRSTRNNSFANTLAVASNYELEAMRHGFDPSHEATIKDFQLKNIGNLKSFKTSKITHSKEQIEMIHA